MKLLDKILVPITLEEDGNPHIRTAVSLSKAFKSKLIFIHVLPEEAKHEKVKKLVSTHVDNALDTILKDVDLEEKSFKLIKAYGNTFDRIIAASEDQNVNLILFSNFIEKQNDKYSTDVVAEKLVRKSEKPVWIVKKNGKAFPDSMLCTLDYSDASRRALNNAIRIARTFKKHLYILNVLKPIESNFSPRYSIDFEEENARNLEENKTLFDRFLSEFDFTDIDYEAQVVTGVPEAEIQSFIKDKNIDLLFMGATGKTFLQRILLGSVTEKLIRELPTSMVITKSESILNLKIDSDISEIEKHLENAKNLEASGYYEEAIHQLKLSLQKNDLHIPSLDSLARIYDKIGEADQADTYRQKIDVILRRLWDKKIEFEIRKGLEL